jgi:hypothetical protein
VRTINWITAVAIAVVFPVAALAAALAYLVLRRRWSDRLVAVLLTLLAGGVPLAVSTAVNYWVAWLHITEHLARQAPAAPTFADWATIVSLGVALGPAFGWAGAGWSASTSGSGPRSPAPTSANGMQSTKRSPSNPGNNRASTDPARFTQPRGRHSAVVGQAGTPTIHIYTAYTYISCCTGW